jgi:hypothetical protein
MILHCKRGKIVQKVDPVVERAIQEAVNQDDLREWAMREPIPLPALEPKSPFKLTPATAFVLGRQMIKKSISIMTP